MCYLLLPSSNRCSCKSWHVHTWARSERLTCRHVLAARLAQGIQGKVKERPMDEDKFVQMLADMK